MFRKIHSNRDSQDTLFSELGKEFAVYIGKFKAWFTQICHTYPKQVYSLMVILMLSSFALSFLFFQKAKPKSLVVQTQAPAHKMSAPVQDGFGQIIQKGQELKDAIALKSHIETLLAKDSLSSNDSVALGKAIDALHDLSIKNQ